MLTAVVASLVLTTPFQGGPWPENPSADFTGIPRISGANVTIVSHNAQVELFDTYASVSSTTLVKNNGGVSTVSFFIPRERIGDATSGPANFAVAATWVNQPVKLGERAATTSGSGKMTSYVGGYSGSGAMKAGGSYALRVTCRIPLGKSGFDRKQNLAAYDLTSPMPIGTMMCTYRYGKGLVFRLPEAHPDLGWQIGEKGVFLRRDSYAGDIGITSLAYYPGGFKNIGGGGH